MELRTLVAVTLCLKVQYLIEFHISVAPFHVGKSCQNYGKNLKKLAEVAKKNVKNYPKFLKVDKS